MEAGLTTSQILAASSDVLKSSGYRAVLDTKLWGRSSSRVFEDPYGIVALVMYETWAELERTWTDAQGDLVELISSHVARPEPKTWDGYLVLLTPTTAPMSARSTITNIRYDTNRVRKLVAEGDELQTLDDVEQALLPLLPLVVETQSEGGTALLDRLPALLEGRGVDPLATREVVRAFAENRSIIERLHELLQAE